MPDITVAKQAWTAVKDAAGAGEFVPVLGLEISCLPAYGDAPVSVAAFYGQEAESPVCAQTKELEEVARRKCEIIGYLRAAVESEVALTNLQKRFNGRWITDVDEKLARRLQDYLTASSSALDSNECALGEGLDDPDLRFIDLKIDLVNLALSLTQAWTTWLSEEASPISRIQGDTPAQVRFADNEDVNLYLAACVDHCAVLLGKANKNEWEPPANLHIEWIYQKLLLLASQVFGSAPDLFWVQGGKWSPARIAAGNFVGRHAGFIRRFPVATNWALDEGDESPHAISQPKAGVRLSHALWVDRLLSHVLFAGTHAHRTSGQLAFLMSMHEKITELPNLTADPFEVGLLYAYADDQGMSALKEALENSERVLAEGALVPRPPDAFHIAVARIFRDTIDGLERGAAPVNPEPGIAGKMRTQKPKEDGQAENRKSLAAKKQIIVSLSLDREMERALERELDVYRLLVPVWLPLRNSDTRAEGGETSHGTWMYGTFRRIADSEPRTFECLGWVDVESKDGNERPATSLVGDGPLLVKLFGSPLTDVGTVQDYQSRPNIDLSGKGEIRPRVVLDEGELLRLLFSAVPDQVSGLRDALLRSKMFFFGQDAVTWSDRIPFLMMESLRGSEGESRTRSNPVASTDGGATDPPISRTQVTAIGNPGSFGGPLFTRLQIARNVGVIPMLVAREIMEGAISDGI